MKVSVIVPVYNAEKYLKKCINSILNQTFKDIEVIAIEDGSSDNSYNVLKNLAQVDTRLKVFKNAENIGVDKTRFRGIELSTGEYLMFVDSDDWISSNAIEKLYDKITKEDADVVCGSFVKVLDKFGFLKRNTRNNYSKENIVDSITLPELFEKFYISYFGVNKLLVSMCGKLYKKEVIVNAQLKPSGMKMGEDLLFNLFLHPNLKKMAFIEDVVYFYRWGGMTSKHNPTFLQDIKQQYSIKKNKIEQYQYNKALPFIRYELVNCFYSHFLNHLLINRYSKDKIRDLVEVEIQDNLYMQELKDIDTEKAQAICKKDTDALVEKLWSHYSHVKAKYRLKRIMNIFLS